MYREAHDDCTPPDLSVTTLENTGPATVNSENNVKVPLTATLLANEVKGGVG